MGRSVFIRVDHLERKKLSFDEEFDQSALSLPDNWRLKGDLRAAGEAELLDKKGSRTIRVRGRIKAVLANTCAIGLEPIERRLDDEFELFYYPMAMIAKEEQKAISRDDTDIGFYEEPGMPLADVVLEQISLWLPMRPECEYARKDFCPFCEKNLGKVGEQAAQEGDTRWAALKDLKLN